MKNVTDEPSRGILCLLLAVVLGVTLAGCEKTPTPEPAARAPYPNIEQPKLGVCTSVSNADKVKAAGFDYIEEGVQRLLVPQAATPIFGDKLVDALAASLPVYAYSGFLPADMKCVGPEANHEAILAYAKIAFDRASQVGSKIIVFGSGRARRVPEGFSHEQATEQFIQLLKKMGPIAAEYHIIIAIEPLNKNECNLVNTVQQAVETARKVDHPNIRVLADLYHMALEDEGPESILEAGSLLVHVHLAEKEGRTRPGVSSYDFTPYFDALRRIGYTGGISLECRWENFDEELLPARMALKDQLDQVWSR
jgi:sugar phosphate isomerase/epimerase